MRTLFTIHAGEYLVCDHIQRWLKLNVWIPAKDTGIDLLVTDHKNRRAVSLQVKHGKDHLPGKSAKLRHSLRCLSWFALNKAKLEKSQAEFWVFVLHGFDSRDPDFVVIPTTELKRRMTKVHHSGSGALHIYLCSTKNTRCWETRELRTKVMLQIAEGTYENPVLEFTQYLNEKGWAALTKKLTA